MAGIERLEIHSKSYIVRWVKVEEGHTLSWSIQPDRKSINFGLVKHPGSGATKFHSVPAVPGDLDSSLEQLDGSEGGGGKSSLFAKKDASTAREQLANKGFILVKWHGKCEADKVSMGTHDVGANQGGMFGMIFDNTFSKQISKTATLVILTYPTGAPPQGAHYLPNMQAASTAATSKTSLGKPSPQLGAAAAESAESLPSHAGGGGPLSSAGRGGATGPAAPYHAGTLYKRRRKKGQGHARRFFSLDYSSCTLSYYHNRNSSALRGAIPLGLAAIAADERRREISIDSGAEIWHLRAANDKEFQEWAQALERASRVARGVEPAPESSQVNRERLSVPPTQYPPAPNTQQEQDRDWQQVEALVSRIVGTRDALRRLVKDMAAEKQSQRPLSSHLSPSSADEEGDAYFAASQPERRPFWKRKSSTSLRAPGSLAPTVSSSLAVPMPSSAATTKSTGTSSKRLSKGGGQAERSTEDHCAALLNDLDLVVADFTNVIANSKKRRSPLSRVSTARKSMESSLSADEFFDAEAGEPNNSGSVLVIDRHESDAESPESVADDASIDDVSSVSSIESDTELAADKSGVAAMFPLRPKSLHPLPIDIAVDRRNTIPSATVPPPSLIAFFRKNVGKDLSTISMPVSANEPTSMLQRVAEQLEYAQLLDQAAQQKIPRDRLLFVTAFAISSFSISRAKERAMRKPFNPLLGETFEFLRTENEVPGGFRLLVEKVTHRPVRLAMQADAENWSLAQSPAPGQKFWGKSAEITTDGRVRLELHLPDGTDELYSWNIGTMFLRNVVMGEKYVEPVGNMTVSNESSGAKANVEFKTKGMFGGRCEDVQADTYGPDGAAIGVGLIGTWTKSLQVVEGGKSTGQEIWKAGHLVPNAATTYGLTTFAASLNEITDVEKNRLPPTDTRLRQDQRLAEQGKLDDAEIWKVKLEEAQRARRREMEERGEDHKPKWFYKVADTPEGEEVWRFKGGKDSYWEERGRGDWKGVEKIFDVPE